MGGRIKFILLSMLFLLISTPVYGAEISIKVENLEFSTGETPGNTFTINPGEVTDWEEKEGYYEGTYSFEPGTSVSITAHPKPGYYAEIVRDEGEEQKTHINFSERQIDGYNENIAITISFHPISATVGDLENVSLPDLFNSYPVFKDVTGDEVQDRLEAITINEIYDSSEWVQKEFFVGKATLDPENGWEEAWNSAFSGLLSNPDIYGEEKYITQVKLTLTYEKGYRRDFMICPPDQNTWESVSSCTVYAGESVTFPSMAFMTSYMEENIKGYEFGRWYNGTETAVAETIEEGSANIIEYKAEIKPIPYTIDYKLNGGTLPNPTTTYNIKDSFTLPTPTKTGYTFTGWTEDGVAMQPTKSLRITQGSAGDKSYTAHWEPINYTITYKESSLSTGTYTIEAPFTLPTPTKTGYDFKGWTGEGLSSATKSVTIPQGSTGSRTYTANWSLINYTITYKESSLSTGTYNIESSFTLPTPTKTGYTFTGWTGEGVTQPTKSLRIAQGSVGDREYTANWSPIEYTITYLGGGTLSNPKKTYTIKDSFTLPTPTKTGYTFTGWTGEGVTQPTKSLRITQGSTGNREYTANWTPKKIVFFFDISPDMAEITTSGTYNGRVTLEYPGYISLSPKPGYSIKTVKIERQTVRFAGMQVITEYEETESVEGDFKDYKFTFNSENAELYNSDDWYRMTVTLKKSSVFSDKEDGWSFCNTNEAFVPKSAAYCYPKARYDEIVGPDSSYYNAAVKNGSDIFAGNCAGMSVTAALFSMGKLNWDDYHTGFEVPNDFYEGFATREGSKYKIVRADSSSAVDKPNDIRRLIEDYQIYINAINLPGTSGDLYRNYYVGTYPTYLHNPSGKYISNMLEILKTIKDPVPMGFYGQYNETGMRFGHEIVARTDIRPEDMGNGWWRVYVYDPNYPAVDEEIITAAGGKVNVVPSGYITDNSSKGKYVELNPSQNKWRYISSVNAEVKDDYIGCNSSGSVEYRRYTQGGKEVTIPDIIQLEYVDSLETGDFARNPDLTLSWMPDTGSYISVDEHVNGVIYDGPKALATVIDGYAFPMSEDVLFDPYLGDDSGGRLIVGGRKCKIDLTSPGLVQVMGNNKVFTVKPENPVVIEADLTSNTLSAKGGEDDTPIMLKTANVYSGDSSDFALMEGTLTNGHSITASFNDGNLSMEAEDDFKTVIESSGEELKDDSGEGYKEEPKETPGENTNKAPEETDPNLPEDFRGEEVHGITVNYYHNVPFWGKSRPAPGYFGMTVSMNGKEYTVSKIKIKKNKIRITGLHADKEITKSVKNATKKGLPFETKPYLVTDSDILSIRKKNGRIKSVKVLINGKYYKAKYKEETGKIVFDGKVEGEYEIRTSLKGTL